MIIFFKNFIPIFINSKDSKFSELIIFFNILIAETKLFLSNKLNNIFIIFFHTTIKLIFKFYNLNIFNSNFFINDTNFFSIYGPIN